MAILTRTKFYLAQLIRQNKTEPLGASCLKSLSFSFWFRCVGVLSYFFVLDLGGTAFSTAFGVVVRVIGCIEVGGDPSPSPLHLAFLCTWACCVVSKSWEAPEPSPLSAALGFLVSVGVLCFVKVPQKKNLFKNEASYFSRVFPETETAA